MERAPLSADVRANLADALVAQGRKDEALTVLREGVARRPDSALLQRSLGAALEQSGSIKEAADAYRAYVRLSPDAPDSKALAERASALEKSATPQS
jgi:predicted Zn-dependent protease